MAAGILSLSATPDAQKGVRVGVSVSVPVRPMDAPDKSFLNTILILILIAVGAAFALRICCRILCAGVGVLDRVNQRREKHRKSTDLSFFLPPAVTGSNRRNAKLEIEQAKIRRQEWEERTAKVRLENAEREARRLAEKDEAA